MDDLDTLTPTIDLTQEDDDSGKPSFSLSQV